MSRKKAPVWEHDPAGGWWKHLEDGSVMHVWTGNTGQVHSLAIVKDQVETLAWPSEEAAKHGLDSALKRTA